MAEPGQPQRSTRLIAGSVGVVVLGLVALLAVSGAPEVDDGSNLVGARAPAVAGTTLDGDPYDLDDRLGSWVLVNFFATWCAGCVNEHPDLVELERWGAERGDVELVSVVFNDPVDQVQAFFAERGGTWPVLNNPTVPVDYRVAQIPETFLVAPSGRVVVHVEGEVSAPELKRFIEEASS